MALQNDITVSVLFAQTGNGSIVPSGMIDPYGALYG